MLREEKFEEKKRFEMMCRKFANIIVCILVIWGMSGCAGDVQVQSQMSESSIVKVTAGNTQGSGVIYALFGEQEAARMVIVTAGHVLSQANDAVDVAFWDGLVVEGCPYIISETSEVAFIEVMLSAIPDDRRGNYPVAKVDKQKFDTLKENEQMCLLAAPTEGVESQVEGKLLYSWIYVEDFAQYMMLVKGASQPGMSGGGLFDSEGNYVGVLCGVNEAGETAAVPLSVILAQYMLYYE